MKKFFTLVMALVAVMAINATVVTFDFTDPEALGLTKPASGAGVDLTDDQTFTVDGVVFSQKKVASTKNRIWNAAGTCEYRTYTNSTLTITADDNITAIEFAGSAINFTGLTGKTWTATEDVTEVTFTASATSKINTITVTVGEAPVVWTPDTISVSQANALIAENDSHDHYVIGVLMGAPFNTYSDFSGSVCFWMSDVANPTDSIEFYQGTGEGDAKWASLMEAQETLHKGDTVLVYAGALKAYGRAENDTITEITGGHYAEMIGANPDPEEVEYPKLRVADAIAVAEALEPAKGKSKATTQIYEVYGYVVLIKTNIGTNKVTSYYLADEAGAFGEFQAYDCEVSEEIAVGDFVKATGSISHYYGESASGEYHNYEISKGVLVLSDPSEAPEGIENVVLTEKAQKVMVNGVLYIVRDNKMFDVRGAQVR